MLTFFKLLLPEVAGQQRVAALLDATGEVLAGSAHHTTLAVLLVVLVGKAPPLATSLISAYVLLQEEVVWQLRRRYLCM